MEEEEKNFAPLAREKLCAGMFLISCYCQWSLIRIIRIREKSISRIIIIDGLELPTSLKIHFFCVASLYIRDLTLK